MKLFLDDCIHRTKIWTEIHPNGISTASSKSMIALLKLPIDVHHLFLDHDLDGVQYVDNAPQHDPNATENTGMEVVEWLEKNHRAIGQIVIHSCNANTAPIMVSRLQAANYNVVGCPFWVLIPQLGR